jgi:uncharacterized protein
MMFWTLPLFGGICIGISASLMLLFHGRVTGISGIISNSLNRPNSSGLWRYLFLSGLFIGGIFMSYISPEKIIFADKPIGLYILAGLLVGFGTTLGNGCTSGHGVCGISRFSKRSLVATVIFITAGIIT